MEETQNKTQKVNYKEEIEQLKEANHNLSENIVNKDVEIAKLHENYDNQIKDLKEKYESENKKKIEELKASHEKQIEEFKNNVEKNFEAQQKYVQRRESEVTSCLNFVDSLGKILDGFSFMYNYIKTDLIEKATKEGDKK